MQSLSTLLYQIKISCSFVPSVKRIITFSLESKKKSLEKTKKVCKQHKIWFCLQIKITRIKSRGNVKVTNFALLIPSRRYTRISGVVSVCTDVLVRWYVRLILPSYRIFLRDVIVPKFY